ncbi:M15 family metallopeptidase [Mycobacterium sp. CSUR Q5927]|nr:M15 family metallopeptidase [Mycobacterium sp. CSUR Q5927]
MIRSLAVVPLLLAALGAGAAWAVPGPPPVSPAARAAGFVDVRSAVPDAILDLRYATANNFTGVQLYPANARCLVHESLAPGLTAAADALRGRGRTLVFWDCYRPHDVQVRMFEVVPDPNWVARPGPLARSHETGRSVDVTTADPQGRLVEMGTDFDDFSPRAAAFAGGISARAAAERAALRDAMSAGGLAGYSGEWWHFDGPGAGVGRPILDVAVN